MGNSKTFKRDTCHNLNSILVGHIITETNNEFEVRTIIKQSLLVTKIEMRGPIVRPVTLDTTSTKELDNNKFYYVNKSTPKNLIGASILARQHSTQSKIAMSCNFLFYIA